MAIKARQVSKVIISGEWFSVELGTFEIVPDGLHRRRGQPGPRGRWACPPTRFLTPNRDRYYGPLSAITLIKLAEI